MFIQIKRAYILYITGPILFFMDMGWLFFGFRLLYEIRRRTGLLKRRFPTAPPFRKFCTPGQWRELPVHFFFKSKEALDKSGFPRQAFPPAVALPEIPATDSWLVNPSSRWRYSIRAHWSQIPDFQKKAGDIKMIWDPARFCFLYDIIRQDYHHGADHSALVLRTIESWISANPVNCGPHWKCSQEITLRVLNWTYALQYYKYAQALTTPRFHLIIHSIYRQMEHVRANIGFSSKAVRNNHVLTEALGLYLTGLLYPFLPESKEWKTKGKNIFTQEISYQIDRDGAFLQHSMNYHRVVVQLLTWAVALAHKNGEHWDQLVYDRAARSLAFLTACQDKVSGKLPRYGNDDGALFFPLSSCNYHDFRPQLSALAAVLGKPVCLKPGPWLEDIFWIQAPLILRPERTDISACYCRQFPLAGYYVLRDARTLTFIRCGSYRHRPFQSDNLHVDLWADGQNLLRDAGTYSYHPDLGMKDFFSGTRGHNTAGLGISDQMLRGKRFMWYHWIREAWGTWKQEGEEIIFEGSFTGYTHLVPGGIRHRRRIVKKTGAEDWTITDYFDYVPDTLTIKQFWHPAPAFREKYLLEAFDENGNPIYPRECEGWYASRYGKREAAPYWEFETEELSITARIRRKH